MSVVRTIGLLGGMSPESSIEYERIINAEVRRALGGVHSANLLLRSYDFGVIERLQADDDWDGAAELLAADARRLQDAGAGLIVLCTNTMHRCAEAIEAAIEVPFLHLADTAAAAVVEAGLAEVGLLGTRYTMEGDFYRARLERHGLHVIVPDEPDRALVHDVIYDELVQGVDLATIEGPLPRCRRPAHRARRSRHHRRLHRDRAAGQRRRRGHALLPDHHAARPGSGALGSGWTRGGMMTSEQTIEEEPTAVNEEPQTTASEPNETGSVPDPREAARPGLPSSRKRSGAERSRPIVIDAVDESVLAMAHRVVELAVDKKASDIVLLDVRGQTTMTDYFVICSGNSDRQLGAIADGIIEGLKADGDPPLSREGDASSHWLLVDFGGVIVHVMSKPEREFYQLEKLWCRGLAARCTSSRPAAKPMVRGLPRSSTDLHRTSLPR